MPDDGTGMNATSFGPWRSFLACRHRPAPARPERATAGFSPGKQMHSKNGTQFNRHNRELLVITQ
ncbi:hypothetical protein ACWDNT_09630 [Streptomyces sp. NPDC000963]